MGTGHVIGTTAASQHGLITLRQTLDLGITRGRVKRRLSAGDWIDIERGVYAIAAVPSTWEQTVLAAILSRSKAIASGMTAGALLGIWGCKQRIPEITIPASGSVRCRNAIVHRRSDFRGIASSTIYGIPTTTAAEALFDLSREAGPWRLMRMMDRAIANKLTNVEDLQAVLDRIEGARLAGTPCFRNAVNGLDHENSHEVSELERMLHRLLDDPRLPPVKFEAHMRWWDELPHRVDAVITDWALILEADGRAYHTKREDFETDRRRDNLAAAHGYRVMRFTWRMLKDEPDRCLELLLNARA